MSQALRIRVLGPLEVARAGAPVELPRSRKTRALLAYLALTPREHPRERLRRLLWPGVDDPRGAPTDALAEAAGLFLGDPLEGLDLPDAPDFQAWCVAQREELRRAELRILDALVERLRATPEEALPYAHRRVRLDREDEGAHVRLVELLGAAGRGREADAHFRTHRRWLEGRGLASGIHGARFVPLESANHLLVEGEPAWSRLVAELRGFLDAP